jgi:hypothetical protein
MSGAASTQSSPHAPRAAPAPLFGVFLLLWIAFMVALVADQGALDSVWNWLGSLPLLLQVVIWVLFLPLALGLRVWESDWTLWVRLVVIVALAAGTLGAFSPRPNGPTRESSEIPGSD